MSLLNILEQDVVLHFLPLMSNADLFNLCISISMKNHIIKREITNRLLLKCYFRRWKKNSSFINNITQNNFYKSGRAIFNLPKLLLDLPTIKFNDKFIGATDYIDGIKSVDLNDSSVLGLDEYGRYFISIKYRCLEDEWEFNGSIYPINSGMVHCLTVFQRYTGGSSWCKAGYSSMNNSSPILYGSPTCLTNIDMKYFIRNIYKMKVGDKITYLDYTDTFSQTPTIPKYLLCELVN